MSPNEFDRSLMEDLSQLPPAPGEVWGYAPWRSAMTKILWGMGLTTIHFEFLYLQYLLPLLGAALLYLGFRSLRKENRWFKLCWVLSGVLLAVHMATDILTATPVMGWITQNPALQWGLTWLLLGMNLLMLFSLWRGTRAAFAVVGEQKPKDWLRQGFICYLLFCGIALWSELVPLTEPSIFGPAIMDQYRWLYYGRGIAGLILEIRLLLCISYQSIELASRGYTITPIPVRISGKPFLLGVFGAVLLSLPIALWVGGHIPTGPAEPVSPLTAEQAAVRDRLVSLGLPEDIAAALDGEELERCAQAEFVVAGRTYDTDHTDDKVPRTDGPAVLDELGGGETELSSWLVFLPEGQVRQIHWFRYRELPSLHLQEQFSVVNSGNFPIGDFSARLLLERDGQTLAIQPEVHLSGGESADEVKENLDYYMFPESTKMELERLGHLRYYPWISFSLPAGAENFRGWLAYTVSDRDQFPEPADIHTDDPEAWSYGDFWYVFLRHQVQWLHYPFVSIDAYGGTRSALTTGPIQAVWAPFDYYPTA